LWKEPLIRHCQLPPGRIIPALFYTFHDHLTEITCDNYWRRIVTVSDEPQNDGTRLFLCEICGYGYEDIETAEACESHCGTRGFASAEIRRKAVHIPRIQVIPVEKTGCL
jgi:rubredoxin